MSNLNDFVIENGTLVQYTGNETDIVIPDDVKVIGDEVFCESDIVSVTMPNSVIATGYASFRGCWKLKSVVLSENIESIGDFSFDGCSYLESINIPKDIKGIGNHAFYGCSSLSKVELPNDIQFIGEGAFTDCDGLADKNGLIIFANVVHGFSGDAEDVIIPSGVTDICTFAFHECESIKTVTIPNTVTSIGKEAFYSCDSLTDIFVPKSVRYFGGHAFGWNTSGLTIHGVADSATEEYAQRYGINFVADLSSAEVISNEDMEIEGATLVKYKGPGGDLVIPEGITAIGEEAFVLRDDLESIVIPEGVISIGNSAFGTCRSLTKVKLPSTLKKIGNNAFGYCAISSLELPENLTVISDDAFCHCRCLEYLRIPPKVISIGDGAFSAMGQPLMYDGVGATVDFPSYLKDKLDIDSLGNINAKFYDADYPEIDGKYDKTTKKLQYMDDVCIALSSKMDMELGLDDDGEENYKITSTNGDKEFSIAVSKIEHIDKSSNPEDSRKELGHFIKENLFEDNKVFVTESDISTVFACTQTTQIVMIFEVTVNIFQLAVQVSSDTALLMIDTLVTREDNKQDCIDELNFMLDVAKCIRVDDKPIDVSGITAKMLYDSLVLGKKVTKKPAKPKVEATTVALNDDASFEIKGNVLSKFKGKAKEVVIPDGITEISATAFKGKQSIESVVIPEGVTGIKANSFAECSHLKSIKLPESLQLIGEKAFYRTKIETIFIPKNVRNIAEGAFRSCSELKTIEVDADNKDVQMIGDCLVNVKSQTIVKGLGDKLPTQGIKEILLAAFEDCKNCKDVVIPEGVEKVGLYAFDKCTELNSISIPSTLSDISDTSFRGFEKLTQVKVDKNNKYYSDAGNSLIIKEEKRMIVATSDTVIPNDGSVTVIGSFTFGKSYQKEELIIPSKIKEIEMFAIHFDNGCKLKTVIFEGMNTIVDDCISTGYFFDGEVNIKGKKGSTAEKFAKAEGYNFEVLGANSEKTPKVEDTKKEKKENTKPSTMRVAVSKDEDLIQSVNYIANVKVSQTTIDTIKKMMSEGEKIKAIKEVRDASGLGLASAKFFVENLDNWDLSKPQNQVVEMEQTVRKDIKNEYKSNQQNKNAANETVKQPKESGCYVATAVYGSYDCPEVWTLRRFRDYSLATTFFGRLFIMLYYAISPTLVKMFGDTKWFKRMWKSTLDKMVEKLKQKGYESTPYEDKNLF